MISEFLKLNNKTPGRFKKSAYFYVLASNIRARKNPEFGLRNSKF